MQNWDDLRYFLALARHKTLKSAARRLGTNETTVARRIKRLEHGLGLTLFTSADKGQYQITSAARPIHDQAQAIEDANIAVQAHAAQHASSGVVRISAVPILIHHVLLPQLGNLRHAHPELIIELAPESRNISMEQREADLALRFARPAQGGLNSKTQKLGTVQFGVFGPAKCDAPETLGWIGYDAMHSSLPQSKWQASLAPPDSCGLQVSDAETALQAVANGLGKAILPIIAGAGDERLRQRHTPADTPPMTRDVWLLSSKEPVTRPAVTAVKAWLGTIDWAGTA